MSLISSDRFSIDNSSTYTLFHCGAVVITTAQFHSTKPELGFYAGSNPARGVSELRDGDDL